MRPSEWLQQREWIQGRLYNFEFNDENNQVVQTGCCMLGAIRSTIPDMGQSLRFRLRVNEELYKYSVENNVRVVATGSTGLREVSILYFNDHVASSKEAVIEVLKKAEQRYFNETEET